MGTKDWEFLVEQTEKAGCGDGGVGDKRCGQS
jgi:hypothetical protein